MNYDEQCVIMNIPNEIHGERIYGMVKRVRIDNDCSYYDTELIDNEKSKINQNVNGNIELDK